MTAPAQQQRPLSAQALEQLRTLHQHQGSPEEAIGILKSAGMDKLQSIKLLRLEWHLSLATAKRLVHHSPSWSEDLAVDNALHETLLHAALDEGFALSAPPAHERTHTDLLERQKA